MIYKPLGSVMLYGAKTCDNEHTTSEKVAINLVKSA